LGTLLYFNAGVGNSNVIPGFKVENILYNVPDCWRGNSIKEIFNLDRNANPKHRMLDSGGYQISLAEKNNKRIIYDSTKPILVNDSLNLTPAHVVNTAILIKPTKMTSLDYPIKEASKVNIEMEFRKKIGYNLTWATETSTLVQYAKSLGHLNQNTQLLIPIQCFTLEQLDYIFKYMKDIVYDGVSIPVRNLNLKGIILFLFYFYKMGIKSVHLLGTSSLPVIALSAYLAKHYFKEFSIDSTSWREAAGANIYMGPKDLTNYVLNYNTIVGPYDIIDCLCPFCSRYTFTKIKNMQQTDKFDFLSCHNSWVINNVVKEVADLSSSIDNMISILVNNTKRDNLKKELDNLYILLSLFDSLKDSEVKNFESVVSRNKYDYIRR